jgi:hypothetical protein
MWTTRAGNSVTGFGKLMNYRSGAQLLGDAQSSEANFGRKHRIAGAR